MVPIRLNLLPPEKKKRTENIMRYLFLKHLMQILILILCISGIALLIGRHILEKNFIILAESLASVSREATEVNRVIKSINDQIIVINAVQAGFVPWSRIGTDVSRVTPRGIRWNLLNFTKDTPLEGTISMTGIADTRGDLLELNDNLKSINWVASVDLPVEALVKIGTEPFKIDLKFEIKKTY